MNKTQARIAAMMLDMAADTYSNHGCNDFGLERTDENEQFVRDMIAVSDYPEDEVRLYKGELLVTDWCVMRYCAELLREAAKSSCTLTRHIVVTDNGRFEWMEVEDEQ